MSASERRADPEESPGQRTMRVAVVDGDPLARRVIRAGLAPFAWMTIVAEAASCEAAIEALDTSRPQALVLELKLLERSVSGAIERMLEKIPDLRIVAFSQLDPGGGPTLRALRAGVVGFVPKEQGIDALAEALAAACRGETTIPRRTVLRIIELLRDTPDGGIGTRPVRSKLTTREWEVLDVMARGATTREVAREMFLSEYTVYSHVKNIMRKLDVHSRSDAIEAAVRHAREPAGVDDAGD